MKCLTLFEDMLKIEYCLSNNTVSSYRSDILQFIEYLEKSQINEHLLILYINKLKINLKNPTIKRKLVSISTWIKFCKENINPDLEINIPLFKLKRNIPSIMSSHELIELQKIVNQMETSKKKIRLQAIIEILYCTGLRISELLSLKYRDIDEVLHNNSSHFSVLGKGNKERVVFLTTKACDILFNYISAYNIKKNDPSIWMNGDKILTRQTIYLWLKEIAKQANIDPSKVFPHSFRHRLGIDLVQSGMELIEVQKIFGHADINSTAIYTQLEDKDIHSMLVDKHILGKKS